MYEIAENLIIDQVLADMAELGISPASGEGLVTDSKLHRYQIAGDKAGSKNGAYVIHTDGRPAWYLQSWRHNVAVNGSFNTNVLSGNDAAIYNKRLKDKDYMERSRIRRETLEREKIQGQRKAIEAAVKSYEKAEPLTTPNHDYLRRKRVENISGFCVGGDGELIIPLRNIKTGKIQTLQSISPNGDKLFFKGAPQSGACYTFEPADPDMRISLIGEGVATAETVYRLTGCKYLVYAAMNCHNLNHIAQAVHEKYPRTEIIIAADNDLETYAKTGSNPGRNRAEFCLNAGFARGVILPDFAANESGSDWNDYETIHGSGATRAEITRQLDKIFATPDTHDTTESAEIEPGTPENVSNTTGDSLRSDAEFLNDFMEHVNELREGRAISTGFAELDNLLDGGFYPGLYSLGAITGLGKTLLTGQIACSMAKSGQGVLIASLEMSRYELIARTLSRETALRDIAENGTVDNALTFREILRGEWGKPPERQRVMLNVIREYQEWGRNLTTIEGVGDIGTEKIRETTLAYMNTHSTPPVIIVDYVQILSRPDSHDTDKQAIDKNIVALKRLSRDFKIPIIAISSFNRENYNECVSVVAFKESGAIEYSSDMVIGLQYKGITRQQPEEKDKDYKARVRGVIEKAISLKKQGAYVPIELRVLKNRAGREGSIYFDFLHRFYLAVEKGVEAR